VVICLERDADLHMAQLIPLPLTVSCFSKIQIGFTFLVPAHLGSPGRKAAKRVCVCVCVVCNVFCHIARCVMLARASLLSGRLPVRNGFYSSQHARNCKQALPSHIFFVCFFFQKKTY